MTRRWRAALLAAAWCGLVAMGCGRHEGGAPAAGAPAGVAPAEPGGAGDAGLAFVSLKDVTSESGLAFRHVNGASGRKYMPETLGSGVCVFDYDGDGRQDVFFVQSGSLPGWSGGAPPRAALFRNLGGRFEEVTGKAGLADEGHYGMGCVAGDVDGDGDRDLYVTGYGGNRLFRNNGDGTFTDDTLRAGVGGKGLWGSSATLFDADGDGDLDLYVANYVAYDLRNDLYCGENRPGYRTVCHPKNFDSQPDILYRNRGDGTFEDGTARARLDDRTGKGLGVVAGDYDDDGDDDLYVANDDTPNFLLRNRGDGTFDEVGETAGVALSEDGVPQAGMGTDMADYDGDGRLDIFVTNLAEEMNELYHNDGNGLFSNATYASGLGPASLLTLGFGTFFFDPDQDGWLDVFVGNGHIIDNIGLYSDTVTFEEPALLFRQSTPGRFTLAPAVGPLAGRYVIRGAVPFDFDDDGDEDLLVTQNDRPALLWRNDGPARGHWLTITLQGKPPNRDAIGARVIVTAGDRRLLRYARTGSSYASQADRRLHFGLGGATTAHITVRWPGRGGSEEFEASGVDRFLVLSQGGGRPARTGGRP
ncbi:MAG TPA: CRTAC1 family protein [Patescibacteria group bacterium]|nr:CRTAC1 family protein [Patescibacteria group bacterium]